MSSHAPTPYQGDPRLTAATAPPRRRMRLAWSDPTLRSIVWQAVILAAVAAVLWYVIGNTARNLAVRHIATGFGFLGQTSGVPIGETLLPYTPGVSTYAQALLIGVLNTAKVALVGVVLATLLGTLVGVLRLSPNWLAARLAAAYVELIRDVPVLLQLLFWYGLTLGLPAPRQAIHVGAVFLSNRGIKLPTLIWQPAHSAALLACALGIALTLAWSARARRRQAATGRIPVLWPVGLALIVGLPLLVWAALGAPAALDRPALHGFGFSGGLTVSPEYAALLIGLVIYTAAYIAEIVRSGIEAVPSGQWEAAAALGLHRGRVLRLIVLPQALRVIIPPLTSEYLNLTKNSSLAVAIGYPDIVSIADTTLNQTGQAIEGVAIIMVVYLVISLSISALMNWYNARIALVER